MGFLLVAISIIAFMSAKKQIRALILPKFEKGSLNDSSLGEAELYYREYINNSNHVFEKYEIKNCPEPLFVNEEGVAMIVTMMGKAQSGQTVTSVLADDRFEWEDTLIVSTGCGGSPPSRTVLGDVVLGDIVLDHELGHSFDKEDLPEGIGPLFARDDDYDTAGMTLIDVALLSWAYELTKNTVLNSTTRGDEVVDLYFAAGLSTKRQPKVLIGGILTGDNYWGGQVGFERAEAVFKAYNDFLLPEVIYTYTITEMEDAAIGVAAKRAGLGNHYLVIRDSVDFDVPLTGESVLEFWRETSREGTKFDWGIFDQARQNNFAVGKTIIDAWLAKTPQKFENDSASLKVSSPSAVFLFLLLALLLFM